MVAALREEIDSSYGCIEMGTVAPPELALSGSGFRDDLLCVLATLRDTV